MESLFVFDSLSNTIILQHWWRRQSFSPDVLLATLLDKTPPHAELLHITSTNPPTLLYNIRYHDLVFAAPSSAEVEPLLVLESLRRIVDVLEDYFSPPLLPSKIEGNYDTIVQLLGEMCDDGNLFNTEPNALKDVVQTPTLMGKLLGSVTGLPTSLPTTQASSSLKLSTVPWRRSNVKHVNNELYVDIVETVQGVFSPSGQALSLQVNGNIAVNSKLSGVPDLLLSLRSSGGSAGSNLSSISFPCFHPCVRLSRWDERPGELSFIPPDGKFILATYQSNLLTSSQHATTPTFSRNSLPIFAEIRTLLGELKTEFEIRLSCNHTVLSSSSSQTSPATGQGLFQRYPSNRFGSSSPSFGGASNSSSIDEVVLTIPLPATVKSLANLRASKGDVTNEQGGAIIWRLSGSILMSENSASLHAEVATSTHDHERDHPEGDHTPEKKCIVGRRPVDIQSQMPRSILLSYGAKGWLASGVRVDGLAVVGKSAEGVKPYKGVKYLSRVQHLEFRC